MFTSRAYNENYFISRKKILDDFLKDEEQETMKYIDDIESIVSSTKLVLKGLVSGELDYAGMKEKLMDIEAELTQDCGSLEQDISTMNTSDKNIEQTTLDLQKQEEKGTTTYLDRIEELKKDLEVKEFKIQNMERLYVELENIIKENIRLNNEQLLSLEQFSEFVSQNAKLQEECDMLEDEKKKCTDDYNNLLRENVNLRSKDESFEIEKIKDALEEISAMGNLHKEAEAKINKLQDQFKNLNKECNGLTNQIKTITKNLESLNIDNLKLNKEIAMINRDLYPSLKRLNKSFTESTNFEDDSIFAYSNTETCEETLKKLKKKNRHTKTSIV
jgi:chromosome segregation ATPase